MKKLFLVIFLLSLLPVITQAALTDTLSGRILLQVEDKGQAWYVDPITKTRSYLGRPTDAFAIMRVFGHGITNQNLSRIGEEGKNDIDLNFAKKFSGYIFLQVQSHGEAWYINPVNFKRYYLGRPADAFRIMRTLGLGITNANLEKIPVNNSKNVPPTPSITHVNIQNFAFNPKFISIKQGTTVIWTNLDSTGHTVTADPGSNLPELNSDEILTSGGTYSFTFAKKGTFTYHCKIHPTMTGTVIVE